MSQSAAGPTDDAEHSLRVIRELFARQKRVEELVHRQEMPRHELVENLLHKQHTAELRARLEAMPPALLAKVLQRLPADECLAAWRMVRDERAADVLPELPTDLAIELLGDQPPPRRKIMLNAFELTDGRLRQIPVDSREDLAGAQPIWVDLIAPAKEERQWVQEIFGLELPDPDDLTDLEESARFYIEDNGEIHLHSDFLLDREDGSRNVAVAFILYRNVLFSVRKEELPVFRLQRLRARMLPGYVSDGKDVLLDLYAADVEYSADTLEDVYASLEEVGKQVLSQHISDEEAGNILAEIAQQEDLNGRIRRNVLDTRRAVSFLMRGKLLTPEQYEDARQILRDIESLDGHTAFIFNKINFLMDATVGFININQNKIIKIFSVASVAMLPPTLIASIYGMNFEFMPELKWEWGYPFSLLLMAASVTLPFWFFHRKGWLR